MSTEFPASHLDLLQTQVASLTTISASGFPQSTAVWFLFDEGKVRISLSDARVKTRNLLRNPKVSLMILDLHNPMRFLDIRGTAKALPDPDYSFAAKVGAKYGAGDLSDHDQPGDVRYAVTIEPRNVYAADLSS